MVKMAVRDTIEITAGVHSSTTRLTIKQQLERFGAIDICHKIGDPQEDTPWVRFRDGSSADKALDAINRGEVLIDGVTIKAQWRGRKKDSSGGPRGNAAQQGRTSRDIFLEACRGGSKRSRSSSTSRSRRRRGRGRSRSCSRKRRSSSSSKSSSSKSSSRR
eukprot:TRINITY_DN4728_c0_g2_i1.p1 TRINITY_DN4728_c0_g2~~TRINITY_DN4728_c0_g2_i1.p1  ORF type:complete len:161 (+),score=23.66 TRINITY_DN4728_c0_g2_i1:130-612(+)